MLHSTPELMRIIADRARERRLAMNFTQLGLSRRSGVSLAVIRLFEHSGKISLESLLKIALALGSASEFATLFEKSDKTDAISLDQLIEQSKKRKRGRVT